MRRRSAIYEANVAVSKIGEYFIYAVFLLGFAVLGLCDSVWKFSQTWVWLSVTLYVIAHRALARRAACRR